MKAYIEILRPVNCIMAAFAVGIGIQISGATLYFSKILLIVPLAFIVAFLICGFGNVINDYVDYEIDRINRPSRPIPSGRISLENAHIYAIVLLISGNILAIPLGEAALAMAVFNSIILYLYAWRIKNRGGLLKNITVSYLVASPFIYGGIVSGKPESTLVLAALAGLANISREIIKDIEDIKGDSKYAKTLPSKIGIRKSSLVASIFLISAVAISPIPYITGLLGIYYIPAVVLTDMIFLAVVFELLGLREGYAKKIQKEIKIGMLFGLVAFLLGSFH